MSPASDGSSGGPAGPSSGTVPSGAVPVRPAASGSAASGTVPSGAAASSTSPPDAAPAPLARTRSARNQFAATILGLEAGVLFFVTLVGYGLRVAPAALVFGVGLALVVLLVLLAGAVRRPHGIALGWAAQVLVLAPALLVPQMLLVGGLFVVLWAVAVTLGTRIDADRTRWAAEAAAADSSGAATAARQAVEPPSTSR